MEEELEHHKHVHEHVHKNIKVAFFLNLFFSVIELIGGLYTNSISIISDSLHDFGDSISIGISAVLEKISKKSADDKYTYGYARYSVFGAFITSLILLSGSVIMLYNSIPRLINPVAVDHTGMLVLSVFGIVINGIAAMKTSKSNNINEKSINLHMLEDVLGWIAVLVGSIAIRITGLYIIDPILSIGITIYIIFHVVVNIKEIFNLFLEKTPENFSREKIENILKQNEKILDVHHIHIWSLDGMVNYLTLHVIVDADINKQDLIEVKYDIKEKMHEIDIEHVTIEFEYSDENCLEKECNV